MKKMLILFLAIISAPVMAAVITHSTVTGVYVDATDDPFSNGYTTHADGFSLWTSTTQAGDTGWYNRTTEGVWVGYDREFPSVDHDPNIVTTISGLNPGEEYEIRIIYSGHNTAPWGICAGFADNLDPNDNLITQDDPNSTSLGEEYASGAVAYETLLGTQIADTNGDIQVFIMPIKQTCFVAGGGCDFRTWYDGLSYTSTALQQFVQTDGSTDVAELGETSDTIDLTLGQAPTDDVVIAIEDAAGQVTVSPNSVTFTTANWDTPQTITFTAVDDAAVEADHATSVVFTATSLDGDFNNNSKSLTVNIKDDDGFDIFGTYVDADATNTVAADATNPWYVDFNNADPNQYIDNLWQIRDYATYVEGNAIRTPGALDANDEPLENVPVLKTTVSGLPIGQEYDVSVVFWARYDFATWTGSSRWNILAGLSPSALDLYTAGFDYEIGGVKAYGVLSALPGTRSGNLLLAHVKLGTVVADGSGSISAYVDNQVIGQGNGGDSRTAYEGIAYQKTMLDVDEGDGVAVADGGQDTFTVALTDVPGSDVVVNIYEIGTADEIALPVNVLTFTSGNYSTPQTVYVNGTDSGDIQNTTIILEAVSNDTNFDGYMTSVYVKDLQCGADGFATFDLNSDCQVNMEDLGLFAGEWLDCTDPADASCGSGFFWIDYN